MNELGNRAQAVAALLKDAGQTIGVSESSGGGLISACLLAVPGASAYFIGGAVTYTRTSHKAFLGVPDEALTGIRSSTEEYALLNARSVREALGTTWGLAETGASGPTGNRYGDAAGHTCVAVSGPDRAVYHARNWQIRPRSQHVGVCRRGVWIAGECLREAD